MPVINRVADFLDLPADRPTGRSVNDRWNLLQEAKRFSTARNGKPTPPIRPIAARPISMPGFSGRGRAWRQKCASSGMG